MDDDGKTIYSNESEKVSKLLKELTIASGLSYRTLGDRMHLNKDAIQALLQGQRKLGMIEWLRFCKILGISPKTFLDKLG